MIDLGTLVPSILGSVAVVELIRRLAGRGTVSARARLTDAGATQKIAETVANMLEVSQRVAREERERLSLRIDALEGKVDACEASRRSLLAEIEEIKRKAK